VPDADEPIAADPSHQRIQAIARTRGHGVDPTDDAPDEVSAGGEFEELARLAFTRDRLHEDRPRDPLSHELWGEVVGGERPPDRVQSLADHPRIGGPRGIPKVLVRV